MNPIKVFLSIFVLGIGLTLVLAFIGLNTDMAGEDTEDTSDDASHPSYMSACIGCHGADLQGAGSAPSLLDLGHLTDDEIRDILVNGRGAMPAGMAAGNEDAVIEYLRSIGDE